MAHPSEELFRIWQHISFKLDSLAQRRVRVSNPVRLVGKPHFAWDSPVARVYDQRLPITLQMSFSKCPSTGLDFSTIDSKKRKLDYDKVGDYRYISVLNRLQHLPRLAADGSAYSLEIIRSNLVTWCESHPTNRSIVWTSPIEIAIRLISLVQCRLIAGDALDPDSLATIDQLIGESVWQLERRLSRFSSANNHLLAEVIAIVYVGYSFKSVSAMKRRLGYYRELFEVEFLRQTHTDGFSKEQSIHYHYEILEYALVFIHLTKPNSERFLCRVKKACAALDAFIGHDGVVPQIGDADEGALLAVHASRDDKYRYTLAYATFLLEVGFYSSRLPPLEVRAQYPLQPYRGQSFWTFDELKIRATSTPVDVTFLKDSGYLISESQSHKLIYDFGDLGLGPLCAHGHSDLFSFTLNVGGRPIVIDSGTYQYHPHFSKERSYYRGAAAHNTPVPQNCDHANQVGRMQWGTTYKVESTHSFTDNEFRIHSRHNGFQRHRALTHAASIHANPSAGSYRFSHNFDGDHKTLVWPIHMPIDVEVEINQNVVRLKREGSLAATLVFESPISIALKEADISPEYGITAPAQVLVAMFNDSRIGLTIEVGPSVGAIVKSDV